ncbi:hypothetical protein [Curtobacterium sp. MCLR17_054]|uniref:hypothetical protein n=1 Tax=Curtobacterium sp. MCLR17_054 TaxID=2175632 RepID=UPI0011B5219B|nr:hypothetical protein [Curtobacterium sp. MCLR17_054]WIE70343.1 hypothetical protein DEJ08_018835 [Curtobacterium sp. MCLR17_054]
MNRRIISAAAVTLAVAVLLTGCAGNQDKDAVSKLALKDNSSIKGQQEKVAGVWEWQDTGYVVLVKNTLDGDTGWEAFAYKPDGDGWKLYNSDSVSKSDDPERTPHKAACLAVVDTDEDQASCSGLSD